MIPTREKFATQWPQWFGQGKVRCGFYLPEGWSDLVWALCTILEQNRVNIQVDQVKEKFGGLRFDYTANTLEDRILVSAAVELAEHLSTMTCQKCGALGELGATPTGWMSTLCEGCR